MNQFSVVLLILGETPRPDITDEITCLLGPNVKLCPVGCLDEFDGKVAHLEQHGNEEEPIITRLKCGTEVRLAKSRLIDHLREFLNRKSFVGDDLIVMMCTDLCTGSFPELHCGCSVVFPYHLLEKELRKLPERTRLGVTVPCDTQKTRAQEDWSRYGADPVVVKLWPYETNEINTTSAANELIGGEVSCVVMDSMGYDCRTLNLLRQKIEVPVLLPRLLVVNAIKERAAIK